MSSTEALASLASIHIYPLKAARGIDLDQSIVEPWGLAGDRRWLLVDKAGRFVSQREEPTMARVIVGHHDHALTVSAAGVPGAVRSGTFPRARRRDARRHRVAIDIGRSGGRTGG